MRQTIVTFLIGMGIIAGIAALFAPQLAPLIAPGLVGNATSQANLVLLMRLLLLQPLLLGASNTIAALTQIKHRFVLYSISPLLYNLGIIFGAVVLYKYFGIMGLGLGVVLGAAMHMLVQVPYFFSVRREKVVPLGRFLSGIKEVIFLSVPRTFALASTQISLVAITAMASYLAKGSIAIFTFAFNLQAVPFTIIGVSYSVAAFPTLARLHAQGARDEFARYIEAAIRHVAFWAIPATVFVIVLRAQIVRTILGAGLFSWTATRLTAAALALFIISLLAQSVTLLIARSYYASGNTKKPLYFGVADIVVSIGSALLLVQLFEHNVFFREWIAALLRVENTGNATVLMLSLGYALGSIAEFIIGYFFFARDFAISQARLGRLAFESFGASIIGGAGAYLVLALSGSAFNIDTTLGVFSEGFLAGIFGLAVTVVVLYLLKNRELTEVWGAFVRRFRDTPETLAVEPSDVA